MLSLDALSELTPAAWSLAVIVEFALCLITDPDASMK